MEKIINKLIDEFTQGADTYTYNGSVWLIFSETKQWVNELTETNTLWYNYIFFNSKFAYVSMNVVENQHYITKWVENTIQNGTKETVGMSYKDSRIINKVIDNGITNVRQFEYRENSPLVNGVIKNGVKHKQINQNKKTEIVDDIIKNEKILETYADDFPQTHRIEGIMKLGINETKYHQFLKTYDVKDTIQDGTEHERWILNGCDDPVDEALDNGVTIILPLQSREYTGDIDESLDNGVITPHPLQYKTKDMIDKVIDKGIKETKQGGIIHELSVIDVIYDGKINVRPDLFDLGVAYVDKVLEKGVNISGIFVGGIRQLNKSNSVIEYGTKIKE